MAAEDTFFSNTHGLFSRRTHMLELYDLDLYDPAIPLLEILLKATKPLSQRTICTAMFILLTIINNNYCYSQ